MSIAEHLPKVTDEQAREWRRLAADPWLEQLLDRVRVELMTSWAMTDNGQGPVRESIYHQLKGIEKVGALLRQSRDDETIREARQRQLEPPG